MYPRNHMLAQWYFNLPGLEQGVGSMRFDAPEHQTGDFPIGQVDSDEAMNQVWTDLKAFWQRPASQIPPYCTLSAIKWNQIDRDGHYVSDTTRLIDLLGNPLPGGGTDGKQYPNQIALVTSYTTAATRGLAHKGRNFWPTCAGLDSTLRVPADRALGIAGSVATLIQDWGNWDGPDITSFAPCVMSPVRGGASRYISGVDVGRVLDTQRRRRSSLAEEYQHAVVVDPNHG